jgi:hypothetical protein
MRTLGLLETRRAEAGATAGETEASNSPYPLLHGPHLID